MLSKIGTLSSGLVRWQQLAILSLWLLATVVLVLQIHPFISYLFTNINAFFGYQQPLPAIASLRSGIDAAHRASPFAVQLPLLLAVIAILCNRLSATNVALAVLLSGAINATGIFTSDRYEALVNLAIAIIIGLGVYVAYKKKRTSAILGAVMATSLLGMLITAHLFIVIGVEGSVRSQATQALVEHVGAISKYRDERACTMSGYDCQHIHSCDGYLDKSTRLRKTIEGACLKMRNSKPGTNTVWTHKQDDEVHLIGYVRNTESDIVVLDVHHSRMHAKIEIVMSAMVVLLSAVICAAGITLVNIHHGYRRSRDTRANHHAP